MNVIAAPFAAEVSNLLRTTIGAICDQFEGEVQTGPFGSQLHASDYSDEGIPVVMPQDMVEGKISCKNVARVNAAHVNRLSQHQLQNGDIVFSRRGDVSRFAVVTSLEEGWLCGTGSIRIRLNCPDIDVGYLRHFLLQDTVGNWLRYHAKGVTMPNLNTTIVRAIPFAYPLLNEQRRIAAILDKADALRRKRKHALELFGSLTQSMFVEMFGDERNSPFEVKSLDGITDQITDGAHFTPTYVDRGVPFLRVTDIQDDAIDWQAVKYIPEEEHSQLILRCRPKPGDVLLSKNGTIGISRYIDWEQVFSIFVSLCLIKPAKGVLSGRYLAAYLKTAAAQRQLRQHAKTGTVTNLHLTEIRKMLIPLPPIELQRKWEELEATLRSRSKRQLQAFVSADILFSSLQNRAFSGQL